MKKCKGCGYPQNPPNSNKIWLSEDGLCSICYSKQIKLKKNNKKPKKIWEYYDN